MSKFVLLIDNVNMGLGHPGLTATARKLKVHPEKLGDQELILFLNRAKDKFKVMGSQGKVVCYYRTNSRNPVSLNAIQHLPRIFAQTGRVDYEEALREDLRQRLGVVDEPGSASSARGRGAEARA